MAAPISSLLDAFGQIDDPRKARGIRHPYGSMLALTFLGLLCRQGDMAGLQRWAQDHWRSLKGPLGFDRKRPPHATTIGRALAGFSLEQFRDAFAGWLVTLPQVTDAATVAADGKTSKQGHDARAGLPRPDTSPGRHRGCGDEVRARVDVGVRPRQRDARTGPANQDLERRGARDRPVQA